MLYRDFFQLNYTCATSAGQIYLPIGVLCPMRKGLLGAR